MYESHQDLGFVKYNEHDNDTGSSVNELWGRNCLQQAFVRGTIDSSPYWLSVHFWLFWAYTLKLNLSR